MKRFRSSGGPILGIRAGHGTASLFWQQKDAGLKKLADKFELLGPPFSFMRAEVKFTKNYPRKMYWLGGFEAGG